MLHISENSQINAEDVERSLMLLHTTSPSLMLLGSLDAARANLQSPRGQKQLAKAISNAKYLRSEIDKMENIHQLKSDFGYKTDVTKIFIKADGFQEKD